MKDKAKENLDKVVLERSWKNLESYQFVAVKHKSNGTKNTYYILIPSISHSALLTNRNACDISYSTLFWRSSNFHVFHKLGKIYQTLALETNL